MRDDPPPQDPKLVHVRRAVASDVPQIQTMNAALMEAEAERDAGMNVGWAHSVAGHDYFTARVGGDGVCFVAQSADRVVGYLAGAVREEVWRRVRRTELENMFVDPAYRGAGVGADLATHFLRWSRSAGASQALVEVFASNTDAVRFYERHGFTTVGLQMNAELASP